MYIKFTGIYAIYISRHISIVPLLCIALINENVGLLFQVELLIS